jgi:hypothetical protein
MPHRVSYRFNFYYLFGQRKIIRPLVIIQILDRGEIFTCGDNRYGKLGLNQKTYNSIQFTPTLVQKYQEIKVENVI